MYIFFTTLVFQLNALLIIFFFFLGVYFSVLTNEFIVPMVGGT